MKHLDDGRLRAYLDQQLPTDARSLADRHLAGCAACQQRLVEVERRSQGVALALEQIAAPTAPRLEDALIKTQSRIENSPSMWQVWRSMMNRRVTRAIATGVVVLAMLVGVFSFAPTRALARQFLSVFRVRKFAVVQVNPNEGQMEAVVNALSDTLISEEPEVFVDEPVTTVASIEEANTLAGFQARMPSYMPGDEALRIEAKGRTEVGMALGQDSLPVLFELAGMDPGLAPENVGDGMIRAMIPGSVFIANEHYHLVQMLDPVVEYPEGVDAALIGEAGLRIMGLSEDEAQRLSQSIDWANTLLLPVPTEMVQVRETMVAGNAAVLMIPANSEAGQQTLMWEGDGIVNVLSGNGSEERLIMVAESMYD